MGRLIDADAFRNNLVEMTNDPFASTNRPLNWSHAYESVMVELDRMPNAQGWISVKDRSPEEGNDVLMIFEQNMSVGFRLESDWCAYTDDGYYTDCDSKPTHWMPLPEPPKEE